jgi:hypothetical protein
MKANKSQRKDGSSGSQVPPRLPHHHGHPKHARVESKFYRTSTVDQKLIVNY